MRTINAEYKPFGLCSEEVQKELETNRDYIEFWEGYKWESLGCVYSNLSLHMTYRAQIPDEPKKMPLSQEEWLKVSKIYINFKWRSVETVSDTKASVYLCDRHSEDTFECLMNHKAVDALGNPIKLYKFEGE